LEITNWIDMTALLSSSFPMSTKRARRLEPLVPHVKTSTAASGVKKRRRTRELARRSQRQQQRHVRPECEVLTYVKTTMTPSHTSRVPKVVRRSRATPNGQTGTPADIHRRRQIPEYFIVTTTSASIWFDFDVNWSWSCGYYELHSRSLAACFPLWLFEVSRDARVPEMRTFIAYLQMAMLPVLFKMAAGIRHSIQQEWRLFPAGKMYFRYTFSYKHQLNCKKPIWCEIFRV
jgi:hypothetical protein